MRGLKGQVALVTGATGLIGQAISRRLGREGAVVVVASRRLAKAREFCQEHTVTALRMQPLELDLASQSSIERAFVNLEETVGSPSILVANASLREGLGTDLGSITHSEFQSLFSVDVAGHFLCARTMIEHLPTGTPASMVWLSSVYALAGVDHSLYAPTMVPTPIQYASVKASVLGATRYLAALWGRSGCRVNAVVAGGVRATARQDEEFVEDYSAKTMLGRMAQPDEVAAAVAFLSSDEASYVTGACLHVDGGFLAW